jgi:hypothetical protein
VFIIQLCALCSDFIKVISFDGVKKFSNEAST